MTSGRSLFSSKQGSKVIKTQKGFGFAEVWTIGAGDMDDFSRVLYGWSWEENKLFEMALAVVDEDHPDRWEAVAAMVGGKKSAVDVEKHYAILLEDLQSIESGKFDHKLSGEAQSRLQIDCTQSVRWTDEDHNKATGNSLKHNHSHFDRLPPRRCLPPPGLIG